ncbi:P63C domain-containing protein [Erwinia persicina]|uniref:P63C domain-containing protein n=1 Tax=Erwinia persicina TaxID=55211 RepID=UPI000787905D|nr:P63C domain-containing protein [Erwinia persicina]MCQ4105142.1 P63C domain-containing protein [Erwinia persicina]UTX11358.1 P63C domain-containing protein [Erwinia persicina]
MSDEEVLLKAIYQGSLPIGDATLDCAVLEDGTRVLSATSIFNAFGRSRKGMNGRLEIDGTKIPPFLAAKNLESLITQDVIDRTKLITYIDGTKKKQGYAATLLPRMCQIYLDARRKDLLLQSQEKLAIQAEILLSAFAMVGIDALVDEATGYQHDRKHDALRLLLSKYISEGLQKWMLTFPDSFFAELDRLYSNESTSSRKRPQYYGKFINKYVYDPIEHGYLKKELDNLNIKEDGKRRARFHQWLNDNGRNILIHQIGRVQGLMETCPNIDKFKKASQKQKDISIAPYLFDEMNNIID